MSLALIKACKNSRQLESLMTPIIQVVSPANLFDKSNIIEGEYINGENGGIGSLEGYFRTGFIEIAESQNYSSNLTGGKAFYDASYDYLEGDSFNAPADAKYIRASGTMEDLEEGMLVIGNQIPEEYIPYGTAAKISIMYVPANKWAGLKIGLLGDSITAGVSTTRIWWEYANAEWNASIELNAVSGTEIGTSGTFPTPFTERYSDFSEDLDLIIVFGGVNDFTHGVPLGLDGSNDSADFFGAVSNLCSGLISDYPNTRIAFFTPIQQNNYNANGEGDTLEDYANAIIKVCGRYGVPVLDLYHESGLCPSISANYNAFMSDGTHPKAEGHNRMSQRIRTFISNL